MTSPVSVVTSPAEVGVAMQAGTDRAGRSVWLSWPDIRRHRRPRDPPPPAFNLCAKWDVVPFVVRYYRPTRLIGPGDCHVNVKLAWFRRLCGAARRVEMKHGRILPLLMVMLHGM